MKGISLSSDDSNSTCLLQSRKTFLQTTKKPLDSDDRRLPLDNGIPPRLPNRRCRSQNRPGDSIRIAGWVGGRRASSHRASEAQTDPDEDQFGPDDRWGNICISCGITSTCFLQMDSLRMTLQIFAALLSLIGLAHGHHNTLHSLFYKGPYRQPLYINYPYQLPPPVWTYATPSYAYSAQPPKYQPPANGYQITSTEYKVPSTEHKVPSLEYQGLPNGYQAPPLEYQVSPDGYQTPSLGYQAPDNGIQAPSSGYQALANGYQTSSPGYQTPANGYKVPSLGHQNSHPKYNFSYKVNNPYGGDIKSHEESWDGDNVHGVYSLLQPDGDCPSLVSNGSFDR
ncbi:unnamed protein product [Darwinula stevensoni]|uniref:Uncharacterized protein n=1 Tax=Darwinula stevensoni TaxID=69355 RepID=A0A7R9A0F8_9CRUS|nr:unnamed protein product [Darwinula stevensoni]CAG0884541.1 unnamed protein product [Darwinula stevensoni]